MTDAQKREGARQFYQKWVGKGDEEQDARSYWIDILQEILGAEKVTGRIAFEKTVKVDGNTKRIDAYIPETRVLIEQKSLGIALDKKVHQSGGIDLTPYEQAKRYNDNLPVSEKARYIVTCNFAQIRIYDMDTAEPEKNVTVLEISELKDKYPVLEFLLDKKAKARDDEVELSIIAGELVGRIHDRFLEQYNDPMAKKTQNSLNILCVRLVFCLYAEDAGLFGSRKAFSDYIRRYEPGDIRNALLQLFKVLDTPEDERAEMYLSDELEAFPYCNGGLFANENIVIPKITEEIKQTILESANFDWARISPTIFGAVFESTLNPETRRSGGMHYTSIENIHKVIDPLFLDDLKAELDGICALSVPKTRETALRAYQEKLASLKFLDPACGSGNFLTETYVSLRRLENRVLSELHHGQIAFADESISPIKVSIHQFYGIEINDFAVTVAKTALWIAESQMLKETEDVVLMHLDFLPLKTNATIIEGNALQIDWNRVVDKRELNYIMGNPPFVGYSLQSEAQKKDILSIYVDEKGKPYKTAGKIDYVAAWYFKASELMQNTAIRTAFVSTNSITQGEQVASVWKPLYERFGIHIDFAYRTFIWNSEANDIAHVHCVIVGFSVADNSKEKKIYVDNQESVVSYINPYLICAELVFIEDRKEPLCKGVSIMNKGSQGTDDGHFYFTPEEYNSLVTKYPDISKILFESTNGQIFINNGKRYCLWCPDVSPIELRAYPEIMERLLAVKNFRENSPKEMTRKWADYPYLFTEDRQPRSGNYLLLPLTSSENRRYVPIGYLPHTVIANNSVQMIPNATPYDFGILNSNVFMAWMRAVCGRLKSDYRITVTNVYNNFPWPSPTEEQKAKIEAAAQGILDARALYPDCSLADLYDPLTMPPELRKAHQQNDKAVMEAYGLDVKSTSEADCVAFLMRKYRELTEQTK